jgi:hypothetical protein
MRYAKYLTGAIGKRIEQLHQKQMVALSLLDEVSVMQEIAGQAVGNYERAFEKSLEVEDLQQRMRLQNLAAAYVVEALNQVRDMTVAAARVQDSGKAVDMMTVGSAIAQLMQFMEMEARSQLHDPDQFMKRVTEHVNEKLLTVEAVAKTTLTPERLDREVRAMHDSVPEVA